MKFAILLKKFLFVSGCLFLTINSACRNNTPSAPNNNTERNAPSAVSVNQVKPSGDSTPGIPDPNSANANKPAAKTTPGIPDSSKGKTVVPKGATPTPGIPDEKTLKNQRNSSLKNSANRAKED